MANLLHSLTFQYELNNGQNIGEEELITCFWINEHYDDENSDTYIENV